MLLSPDFPKLITPEEALKAKARLTMLLPLVKKGNATGKTALHELRGLPR